MPMASATLKLVGRAMKGTSTQGGPEFPYGGWLRASSPSKSRLQRLDRSDHLPRGSPTPCHTNADDVVVASVIEKVDGATTSATVLSNSNTGAGVQTDTLTVVVGIPCPLHEQSPHADEQNHAIGLNTARVSMWSLTSLLLRPERDNNASTSKNKFISESVDMLFKANKSLSSNVPTEGLVKMGT
ncbi:hypothetical protein ACOSP7_025323 [Xanthoceras sorbifolium]